MVNEQLLTIWRDQTNSVPSTDQPLKSAYKPEPPKMSVDSVSRKLSNVDTGEVSTELIEKKGVGNFANAVSEALSCINSYDMVDNGRIMENSLALESSTSRQDLFCGSIQDEESDGHFIRALDVEVEVKIEDSLNDDGSIILQDENALQSGIRAYPKSLNSHQSHGKQFEPPSKTEPSSMISWSKEIESSSTFKQSDPTVCSNPFEVKIKTPLDQDAKKTTSERKTCPICLKNITAKNYARHRRTHSSVGGPLWSETINIK